MQHPSKYAIFLPVRNGAPYLREAVESVIAQTVSEWQLVVLDNASTDGSAALASSFNHPNIQVHVSTIDLPIWESWHRIWQMLSLPGIRASYVTIIGHDDRLLPEFLASADRLIAAHPAASLYQIPFDMIDSRGALIRPCRPIPAVESSTDFIAARLWGLRDSVGTGYVFRPNDYVSVGGIPNLPYLLYADDLLFARLAKLNFKVAASDSECLYRLHRSSESHQMTVGRIEGQVNAIVQFLAALHSEFGAWMNSRAGNAALACFLAREILVLLPLANSFLMSPDTCDRVRDLNTVYLAATGAVEYRQWLGTNVVSQVIYPRLKQLLLLSVLFRARLGGTFGRKRFG